MGANERTNKPATGPTKFLARLVPAAVAGSAYTSLIRSISSVLHDERPD
ncbi:hypothetical protein OG992_31880 [Micromonospora sp. NBC_00362]|nr:hypothetical protein [Micromonospora sp. NBC_00362]MCX5121770.1 hypothetical protein [Micromonospora sp. NBC_00362]